MYIEMETSLKHMIYTQMVKKRKLDGKQFNPKPAPKKTKKGPWK